jgi:SAM-dependent methyltransferase
MRAYDKIADEYYDASAHPTCANFRYASRIVLGGWADAIRFPACDVGAGDSLLCEVLADNHTSLAGVSVVDDSPRMLAYSAKWAELGAHLVHGAAQTLPFGSGSMATITCCLGDPYNDRRLWSEMARVLEPGGHCIYTTPSFEWAREFRARHSDPVDTAVFVLRDGSVVGTPSHVLSESEQIQRFREVELDAKDVRKVSGQEIQLPLSPKLAGYEGPVVTGYLIGAAPGCP